MKSFGLGQKICDAESKCLSCGAPLPVERAGQQKYTGGQASILIFGAEDDAGHNEATRLMKEATKAVEMSGKKISVELLTDKKDIEKYHVRKLPALIINGSIVSQGIVSDADEILSEIEFLY